MVLVVVSRRGLSIGDAIAEHTVDEDRKLAGRGRDRLGFASTRGGKPTVEGAQRVIAPPETHGRHAEDLRRPIGRGWRAGAEELAPGDLVPRRDREPRRRSASRSPSDACRGRSRTTSLSAPYGPRPGSAVKSTPSHTVYNGSRISKPRLVGAPTARVCPGWPRRLIGGGRRVASSAPIWRLDLVVAVADLGLIEVVALERLAEHEQLLSAVVAL